MTKTCPDCKATVLSTSQPYSKDLLDTLMEVYADAVNNGDGYLGKAQLEYTLMKHDLCLVDARDREPAALAAAPAVGGEALETLIREYARDLRRNSSGGDDYPWEWAKGTADYLEILIGRAQPASPSRAVGGGDRSNSFSQHLRAWPFHEGHDAFSPIYIGQLLNDAADEIDLLSAKKPTWEQIQLLYHQEFESISDHISALDAQIFVLSQPVCIFNDAIEQAALTALAWRADPAIALAIRELKVDSAQPASPAAGGEREALEKILERLRGPFSAQAVDVLKIVQDALARPASPTLRGSEAREKMARAMQGANALRMLQCFPWDSIDAPEKDHWLYLADAALAAQPEITDEMVNLACEVYAEVYHDDDKDMGDAMRAALKAVLSSAPPEQPAALPLAVRLRDEDGPALPQMIAQRRAQLSQEQPAAAPDKETKA
jgi:hypothetical protein